MLGEMWLVVGDSQVTLFEGKEVIWGYQNMCVLSDNDSLKRREDPRASCKGTSRWCGGLTATQAGMGEPTDYPVLEKH